MARSQEDIVAELKETHNNFYTYEKFVFTKVMEKSIVTCPTHGDFEILVNSHQCGRGCQKCFDSRRHLNRLLTQEEFEVKVRKHHGDKYDLSNVKYETQYVKVELLCSIHGKFKIQPSSLMQGKGCGKCGREKSHGAKRKGLDNWKAECSKIHNNLYDYSKCLEYKNQNTKFEVGCTKHGFFKTTAGNHRTGKGCRLCSNEKMSQSQSHTVDQWISDCKEVHSGKYTYENCGEYKNNSSRMSITCSIHGAFELPAAAHKAGQGCKKCSHIELSERFKKGVNQWIEECTVLHNNRYDYSLCKEYVNQKSVMPIICKDHGMFSQSAAAHARGQDCPSCAKSGFDPKVSAYIYILQDTNTVKVGITNRAPFERLKQVNKDSGMSFHVYDSFLFETGRQAYEVEQLVLKELRYKFEQPKEIFDGCTECFIDLSPEYAKHLIEQRIKESENNQFSQTSNIARSNKQHKYNIT